MRRSLFVFAGIAASFAITSITTATAADLPVREPEPFHMALGPYNWSGFYAGINGGYAWGRSSWSDPAVGAASGSFNTSGALIGGQFGYNWQSGGAVFGFETDADWTDIKGTSTGAAGAASVCATDGNGFCHTKQNWIGTTRARLGYAFDRFLPYVTGGVAYGDIQTPSVFKFSTTRTLVGWTAGGGLEYGFDRNWSAKIEYLHVDLGTANLVGASSLTPTLSVPATDNIVRAGVNYRFNW